MPDPIQIPNLGTPPSNPPESSSGEGEFSEFASQYLNSVEEADRPIVSKYIKGWDGNVTQKFQELNDQLKVYQDPKAFYNIMTEQMRDMGLLDDSNGTEGTTPVGGGLPEYEGLPQNFVQEFQTLKDELKGLREFKQSYDQQQQSQSQQQQLDNLLQTLQTEHGEFDQAAVLGRILQGMSPDEAVKDYKKLLQKLGTPERKPAPPVIGTGRIAVEQVDRTKISNDKKARTGLVADILSRLES
jgi:hypothetical protein